MEKVKNLEVEVSKIEQRHNMRDTADVAELMRSIQQHGMLQPVGVVDRGAKLELVFGNRRLAAAKKLGWAKVPAVFVESADEEDLITKNLVENLQRSDPSLFEYGQVFLALQTAGLSSREIGARTNIAPTRVSAILDAVDEIDQELLKKTKFKKNPTDSGIGITGLKAITSAQKQAGAKKVQVLTDKVMSGEIRPEKVSMVVNLMTSGGLTATEAIAATKECLFRRVDFVISKNDAKKIEKRFGMSVSRVFLEHIAKTFPVIMDGQVKGRATKLRRAARHN